MKHTSSIEQVHCAHCGEHCDNEIMLDDKSFCCDGCKTVYSILHDNGLCDYYRYDDHSLTSLKNMSYRKERFAYLDEQEIQDRLLDFQSPALSRTRFVLPQIHCASCLWLLEKLNRINNGIIRSTVDFTRKELSVEFDPSATSLRSIVELLTAIGYEPTITINTNVKPVNNAKKSLYLKIGLAGFATGNIMLFSMPDYLDTTDVLTTEYGIMFSVLNIALATPVLLYSASDYFKNAYRAFTTRSMSLDVPLALGILTLYVRSIFDILMNHSPGFMDSFSGLVFLLLIGKLVQQRTIDAFSFERNYASYLPLSVQVVDDGSEKSQSVTSLRVGDIIRIRNKEIVPTDSVLLSRLGHVDYSFVTGEAAPVELVQGAKVYAGGRIVGNSVELSVQKEVSRSYLTQLWNNDIFKKDKDRAFQNISARFGFWFTAFVIVFSIGAALFYLPNYRIAADVFTAILIIACPCALSLAAPFALNTAMRMMARRKLFLKNTDIVLDMAAADTVVFDKTGTLTNAEADDVQFHGQNLNDIHRIYICALAKHSSHPLAHAIYRSLQYNAADIIPDDFSETIGEGIEARYDDVCIRFGSYNFVQKANADQDNIHHIEQSTVHISINDIYYGYFAIHNSFRTGIEQILMVMNNDYGVHILSGDSPKDAGHLKKFIPNVPMSFRQKPEDKMQYVRDLSKNHTVMMVGDGLNDAAALQASAVGIAITENTAAFTPACDAILSADTLAELPVFLEYARYTKRTIIRAFIISVFYNILGLWLASTAQLTPLITAILMPISSLSIVAYVVWSLQLEAKKRRIV